MKEQTDVPEEAENIFLSINPDDILNCQAVEEHSQNPHEELMVEMIKMQKVKAVGCEDNLTREAEFEKEIPR